MKLDRYTDTAPVEYVVLSPDGELCFYDAALAEWQKQRDATDTAYLERNMLVALLARIYPSGIATTQIEGWDPEWHGCVFVDTPAGQMSWHYHTSHAHLFHGLPAYEKPWDGHTTEQKYRKLGMLWEAIALGWLRKPLRPAAELRPMPGGVERPRGAYVGTPLKLEPCPCGDQGRPGHPMGWCGQ